MNKELSERLQANEKKLEILRTKRKNLEIEIERLERKIANQRATLSIVPKKKQEESDPPITT